MLAVILFSAFDNSNINYLSSIHDVFMNIDENYQSSQRFDQWYNSFDHFLDDVFKNGFANQNRVHFVVFPRLCVRRGKEAETVWYETSIMMSPFLFA